MKTKLAFLALPFCLGLVLTFVLAACDSGSSSGCSGDACSSSSSSRSSDTSAVTDNNVTISNFEAYKYNDKIQISGTINGSACHWIESVSFSLSPAGGQVSFAGGPASPMRSFGLDDVYIDLTNTSIKCGEVSVTVRACAQKIGRDTEKEKNPTACKDEKSDICSNKTVTFTKDASYCVSSSSEASSSSSSEAVWKFGSKQETGFTSYNSPTTIGSINFMLVESGNEDRIRFLNGSGKIGDPSINLLPPSSDEEPEQGKGYPSSIFKDMGSSVEEMDLENKAFYVIFSGSEPKYLVKFSKIKQAGFSKPIEYWSVEEHP